VEGRTLGQFVRTAATARGGKPRLIGWPPMSRQADSRARGDFVHVTLETVSRSMPLY
jgi:hypothetical protein